MGLDTLLYDYIDRFRDLLAADGWRRLLMDLSKNDALALLYLHRAGEVRMSDVAEYLRVPLNTATGVVGRLSRRGLVDRHNSPDDKRVVVVSLTDEGRTLASDAVATILRLGQQVLAELSADELAVALAIFDRAQRALRAEAAPAASRKPRRIQVE